MVYLINRRCRFAGVRFLSETASWNTNVSSLKAYLSPFATDHLASLDFQFEATARTSQGLSASE